MRRNTGRDRRSERIIDEDNKRLLKGVIQFAFLGIVLLISLAVLSEVEQVWTDFSPKTEEVTEISPGVVAGYTETYVAQSRESVELNKEKYRAYFEDKSLVLMVLGGIEWWNMNCGTLSGTGEYFMKLAIKKHSIDINEMNMDEDFQTGLFAATLYNNCSIFLFQVKTIGLGMMFTPTPEEIILDTVPETNI